MAKTKTEKAKKNSGKGKKPTTKEDDAQNTAIIEGMIKDDQQDKMDDIQNDAIIEGMIKDDEQDAKIKEVDEKTASEIKRVEAKSDRNDAMQKDKDAMQDKNIGDTQAALNKIAEAFYENTAADESHENGQDALIRVAMTKAVEAKETAITTFKYADKVAKDLIAHETVSAALGDDVKKIAKKQCARTICQIIIDIAIIAIFFIFK